MKQIPTYDEAHANDDEYASCTPPDKNTGLEGSCSYSKRRKSSTPTDNGYSNGDAGVVYRQAI